MARLSVPNPALYTGACPEGEAVLPIGRGLGIWGSIIAAISAMMAVGARGRRGVVAAPPSGPCVMTMVRSFAFATAAAITLAAAPACAQVKWNLPSAYPADNFHVENLTAFAKDITEATEIKSAVRIGQAQISEVLISLHENKNPVFGVDIMPFLTASYEKTRRLWT